MISQRRKYMDRFPFSMRLAAAAALALALAGCNQAPPPAPDTREADAKALRDAETANQKDWAAKDADKIAGFYADDAVLYAPGTPPVKRKAAIRMAVGDMLKDPSMTLAYTTETAEAAKSGDVGFTAGSYTMTMTDPKTKKVMSAKGSYVTVFKKQADGSWKAVQDMAN
jgi:uncharacterized protein (TIGR02246 family)